MVRPARDDCARPGALGSWARTPDAGKGVCAHERGAQWRLTRDPVLEAIAFTDDPQISPERPSAGARRHEFGRAEHSERARAAMDAALATGAVR